MKRMVAMKDYVIAASQDTFVVTLFLSLPSDPISWLFSPLLQYVTHCKDNLKYGQVNRT